MSSGLKFVEADPAAAAARLDDCAIHLWCIPYARTEARAPLVALLGAYLGRPPSEVTLEQDKRGKPQLAGTYPDRRGRQRLHFNWSHSGGLALVALCHGLPLGVDVERLDKRVRAIEVARRFFDPAEAAVLATLPRPAREHAFIGLWCAKEAVLKAAGEGLSFGLARVAFEWHGGIDWQLARVDPELGDIDAWRLVGFDAAPGYHGALAWRGPARKIAAFQPAGPGTG